VIPSSVNDIQPGKLVVHRYTPEIGLILKVSWRNVEVLLGNGQIARWEFNGFRSCYEVCKPVPE